MSWTKPLRRLLAGAIGLTLTGGAMAATIVVRSNGPSSASYPPGKMLDPAGSVRLKAGDSITVLDPSGTRILSGVGMVPVAGRGTASGTGFGALLTSTGARQARTGATRGTNDGPPRPTNVWHIDSSRAGATCVANPAGTMLWRPRFDAAQTLTVTNLATNHKATLEFAPGQATRTWPAAVPLTEGGTYKVEGGTAPVTIKVHVIADAPATLDAAAQTLIAQGCQNQVDLLVSSTSQL
jgi:hypothetical protein